MPTTHYLPNFPPPYAPPWLSQTQRKEIEAERKAKMDEAITYLAQLTITEIQEKRKSHCKPICSNSVCNLITYILSRPLEIFKSAFCCCLRSCTSKAKVRPIPQKAGEILDLTKEQFERNTFGVCCIAPTVIAGAPFIPASAAIATLFTIISGLVITTTAGTNTYLFSGNIGVVLDSHGKLLVQGGISSDGVTIMKNAFSQLGEYLHQKWAASKEDQKKIIYQECLQIADQKRWEYLFGTIADAGVTTLTVQDILTPFSQAIIRVLDEGEELFKPQTPVLSPDAHFIVINDDGKKA